ncbi:hypothetical protein CCO02nite_22030 [Cellulomonas composti]|uniref:N-acetyltransferase domain-containing protein n=1 Tax=Cellulomonas composti TaxID=266130 RepID=A0A511JC33_9CELL|nr:hypothetical protein CCO02nite_22030 [Cellulomonas composti]
MARGDDVADAGALTAEAYLADRLVPDGDPYAEELRDARRRADEATLLVAVVPAGGSGVVVGTVTLAPYGTSYAEVAQPGEVELRMLAVAPEARRRGIAEALVVAALREAVALGAAHVVLSTLDAMEVAHRLYERLGFERRPERDWGHDEVHLRVLTWSAPAPPGARREIASWPPVHVVDVDGWRVGLSGGVTRRANSALPAGAADPDLTLSRVEAVYALEGQPSVVRVGRSASTELLAALDRRGYAWTAQTDVLVLDPLRPQAPSSASEGEVRVAKTPDAAWFALWSGTKPSRTARRDTDTDADADADADEAMRRAILAGADASYLSASTGADRRTIGVLRAAFVDDWVALSCLVVDPAVRGLGWGRELTRQALLVAHERGARRAFLQVESENAVASTLYASLGFRPADRYVYRERDLDVTG